MTVRGDEERTRISVLTGVLEHRFGVGEQLPRHREMLVFVGTGLEAGFPSPRPDLLDELSYAQQGSVERSDGLSLHER